MDNDTGGVFIALPCHDRSRYSGFWVALERLERPINSIFHIQAGPFIVNNLIKLSQAFLATNCQWFFLINDDQIYLPDTIKKLVAHGKDAVVAFSVNRKPPYRPLLYREVPEGFTHLTLTNETGLIPVDASGGGGLLLSRRVFETIPQPWWEVKSDPDGTHGGEDLEFCRKLKTHGFQLWADLDTRVGHIADFVLIPSLTENGWMVNIGRTF